jgi:hypothetical protein
MATRVTFPFTQKQAFEALVALIQTGEPKYESVSKTGDKSVVKPNLDTLVDFLTYKIGQADKKSDAPKKLTNKQLEALDMAHKLYDCMKPNVPYAISEMITYFDCFKDKNVSSQYVTSLLIRLIGEEKVKRGYVDHKCAFTRIA